MPRHHSKSSELLKCVLAMLLMLSFIFAIYQLIVAEWTTGILWLIASLVGIIALFARSGKAVMATMAVMLTLLFAAFVCHIVILATINSHTDKSYPGQSNAIDDSSWRTIRSIGAITHILGIVFTLMLSAFLIPTLLFLADAIRHHEKHRPVNTKGANEPMTQQGGYAQQSTGQAPMGQTGSGYAQQPTQTY